MKYFWVIFSIYIVVLSTIPCSDSGECNETVCVQEATCEDSACNDKLACNSSEKDCQDETCSPFYFCACCGCVGFGIDPFSPYTIAFNQPAEKSSFLYESQFLSQYVVNIWQPPRLS